MPMIKQEEKGILKEFAFNEEEVARAEAHSDVSEKMHTALHGYWSCFRSN